MPTNTPVKAIADGVVSGVGSDEYSGEFMRYDMDGGFSASYAHLNYIAVKEGDVITKGQIVAFSGNTGQSTGPHLHFTLRKDEEIINPEDYVKLD